MVSSRLLISAVTATASLVLMPVTSWLDGLPNFTFTSPALASSPEPTTQNFSYIPPYRGTPRRTQGTGSRGGDPSESIRLKLLVPNDHTGQTLSGHPTFFWYISELPTEPMEFSLVESGVAQPIFVQKLKPQQAGIIRMDMPKNLPELIPGKEYRWSVTLVDNGNQRTNDTFAQSWIKRVPEIPGLQQQLAAAKSDRDRASIYAKAGLWYDALNTLVKAQVANSTDLSIHEELLSLLARAGL